MSGCQSLMISKCRHPAKSRVQFIPSRRKRGEFTFFRPCNPRRLPVVTQFLRCRDLTRAHKAFSTPQRLAALQRQNSRLTALRQLPLRPLRSPAGCPKNLSIALREASLHQVVIQIDSPLSGKDHPRPPDIRKDSGADFIDCIPQKG